MYCFRFETYIISFQILFIHVQKFIFDPLLTTQLEFHKNFTNISWFQFSSQTWLDNWIFPKFYLVANKSIITGRNEVVAKIIFLHLSVIHSVHRGGLPQCMLGYHPPGADTPPGQNPLDQNPPGPYTPPEQTPPDQTPMGADTPQEQTPPGKQTPAYGLRAAGTHPTGMHSCFNLQLLV